jgi:hypothetical protein
MLVHFGQGSNKEKKKKKEESKSVGDHFKS